VNLISHGLDFPQGNAPGFDPSHPAAQGISGVHGFSGVATGNGFANLITGKAGTYSLGANGSFINGIIGPALNWSVAAQPQYISFPGTTINDTKVTLATIGLCTGGGAVGVATDFNGGGGWVLTYGSLLAPNAGNSASGLTLPTGVPFFLVASQLSAAAVNFVFVNLATGARQTSTVAGQTPLAPTATQLIGSDSTGTGTTMAGYISATMWAPVGLTLTQLVQWSQNPWGFWYPPTVADLLIFSRATLGAPAQNQYDNALPPFVY